MSRYQDYLDVPQDDMVRDKMNDNKNKRGKSASKQEPPKGDTSQTKRCGFCGQLDANFTNESKYTMHLYKECPVLVLCKYCNEVVQISVYTDHLLSAKCAGRHKQCPRCKEAILREDYNEHIKLMACTPARRPEEASRCPLCSADFAPGHQGWVAHIMKDGCPNNERTLAPLPY
jgi:hypothetical protein